MELLVPDDRGLTAGKPQAVARASGQARQGRRHEAVARFRTKRESPVARIMQPRMLFVLSRRSLLQEPAQLTGWSFSGDEVLPSRKRTGPTASPVAGAARVAARGSAAAAWAR